MSVVPIDIVGSGVVSPFGLGRENFWQALLNGHSATVNGLAKIPDDLLPEPNRVVDPSHSRAMQMLQFSFEEALRQSGWSKLDARTGLILATTTGQIPLWDRELINRLDAKQINGDLYQVVQTQPLGNMLSLAAELIKATGPRMLFTSACSAATQSLGFAAQWIRSGQVESCVVLAVEVFCDLTVRGFSSLQLLSSENCRPFDVTRSGINLSEAGVCLLLEKDSKSPLAQLRGAGMSTDAYHTTSPDPEGRGLYRAMRSALERSDLEPTEISWIHAHGTGSDQNDASEAHAIKALFGSNGAPVSSTKAVHGHALGASGALEVVGIVEAIEHGVRLKSWGLENTSLQLNFQRANENYPIQHVLKNTLGFGGNNAAIVISNPGVRT